jgi:hypothetical protein
LGWRPELGFADDDSYESWVLGHRGEGAMFECRDMLMDVLETFLIHAFPHADLSGLSHEPGGRSVRVAATAEQHMAVRWFVDSLRHVADATVNFEVFRAPDAPARATLSASETAGAVADGTIVATVTGTLGDTLSIDHTTTRRYVAGFDASVASGASAITPEIDVLRTGESFKLGALMQADGRLTVTGWHTQQRLQSLEPVETTAGRLELPHLDYSFMPVGAVVENGGAIVFDLGERGRYAVRVTSDRVISHRSMRIGSGEFHLFNPVGVMNPASVTGQWLFDADEYCGGPIECWPQDYEVSAYVVAAWRAEEFVQDYVHDFTTGDISVSSLGPWMGVMCEKPDDVLTAAITRFLEPRDSVEIKLTAVTVGKGGAIPAGVMNGRPSAEDVAALQGDVRFARASGAIFGQALDALDVSHQALIGTYNSVTAAEVAVVVPEVGLLHSGCQMRWHATYLSEGRAKVAVRLAMSTGPNQLEWVETAGGMQVSRAERSTVDARLSAHLSVGDFASSVVPSAEGVDEVVVIIVQRTR